MTRRKKRAGTEIWTPGKAAPKLLPEHMRRLPGELVAGDIDDEARVHELDAPHVFRSIVKDFGKTVDAPSAKPDTPSDAAKKLWAPGPGERGPVTQWFVDVARMRVLIQRTYTALDRLAAGLEPDLSLCHLRFPDARNVNEYVMAPGPQPHKRMLGKHERELELEVDIMRPPRKVVAMLKERGVTFDPVKALHDATEEAKRIEEGSRLVVLAR